MKTPSKHTGKDRSPRNEVPCLSSARALAAYHEPSFRMKQEAPLEPGRAGRGGEQGSALPFVFLRVLRGEKVRLSAESPLALPRPLAAGGDSASLIYHEGHEETRREEKTSPEPSVESSRAGSSFRMKQEALRDPAFFPFRTLIPAAKIKVNTA